MHIYNKHIHNHQHTCKSCSMSTTTHLLHNFLSQQIFFLNLYRKIKTNTIGTFIVCGVKKEILIKLIASVFHKRHEKEC